MTSHALSAAAPARPERLPSRPRPLLDRLVALATFVVLWQIGHWLAGDVALPSPGDTVVRSVELLSTKGFWTHVQATFGALLLALAIAGPAGLAIGVLLGAHRLSGEIAEPFLIGLSTLPKVTLYPVVLLLFGLGTAAKVAFGAIHGVLPIAIFSMTAIRTIRPTLLRSAKVMGLTRAQLVSHVILPAALPEILTGLRIGFSLTLLGVLVGELFSSKNGLGHLLMKAIDLERTVDIMAIALCIFAVATAANGLLLAAERRLRP